MLIDIDNKKFYKELSCRMVEISDDVKDRCATLSEVCHIITITMIIFNM